MSRIQKIIFEAVEAAEAGLKHSNVEGTRYRRKESPIPHQKWKNPLDFCSISDRSVPLGVALLPWVSITALASSGVKPTLGSKAPPSGTLLPEMEKKSSGFFISDEGKRHLYWSLQVVQLYLVETCLLQQLPPQLQRLQRWRCLVIIQWFLQWLVIPRPAVHRLINSNQCHSHEL